MGKIKKSTKTEDIDDIRKVFKQMIEVASEVFIDDIRSLSPEKRLKFLIAAAPFVLPKLSNVSIDATVKSEPHISEYFKEIEEQMKKIESAKKIVDVEEISD